MEPIRRDPFRFMRELFRYDPFGELRREEEAWFTPDFEVKETKDAYLIKADLPGVREQDLDVSILGRRLNISGKRESEKKEEGETFYMAERRFGSFSRSFTLPEGVDADNVKAEMRDGILTLWLAKKPEVQPRKIELGARKKEIKA